MDTKSGCSFSPGDRVILENTGECGVVVYTWRNADIADLEDCYIAFFGDSFPKPGEAPAERPYILRYAAVGLQRVPTP